MRLLNLLFVFSLALVCGQDVIYAQDYPNKTIRMVTGFPPGANADLIGRSICRKLTEKFGEQCLIVSHPGAGGTLANVVAAKAAPDGYTLLLSPVSAVASASHLRKTVGPDELEAVILVASFSHVLVIHPSVPVRTFQELQRLAKRKPGVLTYGSTGVGGSFHLAGELLKQTAGMDMLHVPFRGGQAALLALAGGEIDMAFNSAVVVKPFIDAHKMRGIAVTGISRDLLMPQIPTISESGVSGFRIDTWWGIFVPKGTPPRIISTLNREIDNILSSAEVKEMWKRQGMAYSQNTTEEFGKRVLADYKKYGELIKKLGIETQ